MRITRVNLPRMPLSGLDSSVCANLAAQIPELAPRCPQMLKQCASAPDPGDCAYQFARQAVVDEAARQVDQQVGLKTYQAASTMQQCMESPSPGKCVLDETQKWLTDQAIQQGYSYAAPAAAPVLQAVEDCRSKQMSTRECAEQLAIQGIIVAGQEAGIPADVSNVVASCIAGHKSRAQCVQDLAVAALAQGAGQVGLPPEAMYAAASCVQTRDLDMCGEAATVAASTVACAAASAALTGGIATPLCGYIAGPVGRFVYELASDFAKLGEDWVNAWQNFAGGVTAKIAGKCFDYRPMWNAIRDYTSYTAVINAAQAAADVINQTAAAHGVEPPVSVRTADDVLAQLQAQGKYDGDWSWYPGYSDWPCAPTKPELHNKRAYWTKLQQDTWVAPTVASIKDWEQAQVSEIGVRAHEKHVQAMRIMQQAIDRMQSKMAVIQEAGVKAAYQAKIAAWQQQNAAAAAAWAAKNAALRADWLKRRAAQKAEWQARQDALTAEAKASGLRAVTQNQAVRKQIDATVAANTQAATKDYESAKTQAMVMVAVGALLVAGAVFVEVRRR